MTLRDFRDFVHFQGLRRWLPALLLLAAAFAAGTARASVDLRVEARPVSEPTIKVFITVTDANGDPVGLLGSSDFTVTLDTLPLTIQPSDVTLPPAQDPNQKVSVVFVMDYSGSVQSTALTAMQDAVIAFINSMNVGDFAAIIKFNNTNPEKASVVQPFTEIDGAAGTSALIGAVMAPYPGAGTNLLDAVELAVDQFSLPLVTLPDGPKAVIAITDGGENASSSTLSDVIASANEDNIAVFTVGVGNISIQNRIDLLTDLGTDTGGEYFPAPSDAEIAAAYVSVSELLNNDYVLTIPSAISDCFLHTLQVTVVGQPPPPGSVTFSRRDCDTTPDPFSFTSQTGVKPSRSITSNTVTITGIEGPAVISVAGGTYSIGCGTTFTTGDGTINDGETVCVRHTSNSAFSATKVTTLTVGTVSATFTSTTSAQSSSNGGGGGATGLWELLAGLAALAARRRRIAIC